MKLLLALLLILSGCSATSDFEFKESNDYFDPLVNDDKYYTQGLALKETFLLDDGRKVSVGLDHNIYTPSTKRFTTPQPDNRPYAAHLFTSTKLTVPIDEKTEDTFGIALGMVGPSARGEEAQNGVHKLIKINPALGWDNQIRDEVTANLNYERRFTTYEKQYGEVSRQDRTYYGGNLGNAFTDFFAGNSLALRKPVRDWLFVIYLESEGKIKVRDILLDGNTFKDSASIDKEILTGRVEGGLRVNYKKYFLQYGYKLLTREFSGPGVEHGYLQGYGSLDFGYGFYTGK